MNTLHQEIREILKEIWFEDDIDQATDSILKAIKDRLPKEKPPYKATEMEQNFNPYYKIRNAEIRGYNKCLTDLAERMGK